MDTKVLSISQELEKRLDEIFNEKEPAEELFDDIPETIDETDLIDESSILRQLKAIILSIDWEIKDEYLTDLINESERLKTEYKDDRPLALMLQMLISIAKYLQKKKTDAPPDTVNVLKSVFEGIERILVTEKMSEAEKEEEFSRKLAAFNALKVAIQEQAKKPKKAEELKVEEEEEEKIIQKIEPQKEAEAPVPEYVPFEYASEEYKEARVTSTEPEIAPARPEGEEERPVWTEEFVAPEPEKLFMEKEEEKEELFPETKVMEPHEAFLYAMEEIKEIIRSEFRAIRAELKLWRESQQR